MIDTFDPMTQRKEPPGLSERPSAGTAGTRRRAGGRGEDGGKKSSGPGRSVVVVTVVGLFGS